MTTHDSAAPDRGPAASARSPRRAVARGRTGLLGVLVLLATLAAAVLPGRAGAAAEPAAAPPDGFVAGGHPCHTPVTYSGPDQGFYYKDVFRNSELIGRYPDGTAIYRFHLTRYTSTGGDWALWDGRSSSLCYGHASPRPPGPDPTPTPTPTPPPDPERDGYHVVWLRVEPGRSDPEAVQRAKHGAEAHARDLGSPRTTSTAPRSPATPAT
jgi:hypothetical protein